MAAKALFRSIGSNQRHRPRHEAEIGVHFAGLDKLVHLIGLGEVVAGLGRGFAERLHRPGQIGQGFPDRNQLAPLTLHGLFPHTGSNFQIFLSSLFGMVNHRLHDSHRKVTFPDGMRARIQRITAETRKNGAITQPMTGIHIKQPLIIREANPINPFPIF